MCRTDSYGVKLNMIQLRRSNSRLWEQIYHWCFYSETLGCLCACVALLRFGWWVIKGHSLSITYTTQHFIIARANYCFATSLVYCYNNNFFPLFLPLLQFQRDPNVPDRRQQEDSGTEKLKTQGARHYH